MIDRHGHFQYSMRCRSSEVLRGGRLNLRTRLARGHSASWQNKTERATSDLRWRFHPAPPGLVLVLTSLEGHATMVSKSRIEKASWFTPNHRG